MLHAAAVDFPHRGAGVSSARHVWLVTVPGLHPRICAVCSTLRSWRRRSLTRLAGADTRTAPPPGSLENRADLTIAVAGLLRAFTARHRDRRRFPQPRLRSGSLRSGAGGTVIAFEPGTFHRP